MMSTLIKRWYGLAYHVRNCQDDTIREVIASIDDDDLRKGIYREWTMYPYVTRVDLSDMNTVQLRELRFFMCKLFKMHYTLSSVNSTIASVAAHHSLDIDVHKLSVYQWDAGRYHDNILPALLSQPSVEYATRIYADKRLAKQFLLCVNRKRGCLPLDVVLFIINTFMPAAKQPLCIPSSSGLTQHISCRKPQCHCTPNSNCSNLNKFFSLCRYVLPGESFQTKILHYDMDLVTIFVEVWFTMLHSSFADAHMTTDKASLLMCVSKAIYKWSVLQEDARYAILMFHAAATANMLLSDTENTPCGHEHLYTLLYYILDHPKNFVHASWDAVIVAISEITCVHCTRKRSIMLYTLLDHVKTPFSRYGNLADLLCVDSIDHE